MSRATRQPHQRRADPRTTIAYRCPSCGGAHPLAECGYDVALDRGQLVRLRSRVEHELCIALRREQPTADYEALLAAIESRLGRAGDSDERPTFARRQRIAAER